MNSDLIDDYKFFKMCLKQHSYMYKNYHKPKYGEQADFDRKQLKRIYSSMNEEERLYVELMEE